MKIGNTVNSSLTGMELNGKLLYYFQDRTLYQEASYRNDQLNGLTVIYHQNGQISEKAIYLNGLQHGVVEAWL